MTKDGKEVRNVRAGIASVLVGGLALVGGVGATSALWYDEVNSALGNVEAGNLDVAMVGAPEAFDITSGRPDRNETTPVTGLQGHSVDLSTWRMVPGDKVEISQGVSLGLEGDNLKAGLVAQIFDTQGTLLSEAQGVDISYAIYDTTGNMISEESPLGDVTDVMVQAGSAGQSSGVDDAGRLVVDRTETSPEDDANFNIVVNVTFDRATPGQIRTGAYLDLGRLEVSSSQNL